MPVRMSRLAVDLRQLEDQVSLCKSQRREQRSFSFTGPLFPGGQAALDRPLLADPGAQEVERLFAGPLFFQASNRPALDPEALAVSGDDDPAQQSIWGLVNAPGAKDLLLEPAL